MKFGYEHEEAVSPVIGVILMVAITVILAATVAVFVLGQTDQMESNKVVALKATTTATDVTLTISGGANVDELKSLKFTWDGVAYTDTVNANGKITAALVGGILNSNVQVSSAYVFANGVFHAGDKITVKNDDGGAFVVTGIFADGTESIIYEKSFVKKNTTPSS